jgi:hypothetical protein
LRDIYKVKPDSEGKLRSRTLCNHYHPKPNMHPPVEEKWALANALDIAARGNLRTHGA